MIKKVLIAEDHESANISVQKTLEEMNIEVADYVYYCDDALVRVQKAMEKGEPYDLLITDLYFDADHIAETKDVGHQRDHFSSLSENMYKVIKAAKPAQPVYYQHCPMAKEGKGANWLSQIPAVKNPYYGAQMLNCGKTTETLK